MSEINTEVPEVAEDPATNTPLVTPELTPEERTVPTFTAEDLAKVRAQEKDKVYSTMEKMKEELASLKKEREEREAVEQKRREERVAREAERTKKKQEEDEQELSFKELLKKKEDEFNTQLERERTERESAFALLEREREYQELTAYRQQRLEQERENIIPEMIDLIQGNTADEIEASIATLKDKSTRIFESVANASQQTRKEMVGARITAPANGPLDNDSDSISASPDDLRNMSMADYAKNRQKLLGSTGINRGQGLFG
jgi:hypothetical protein